ncbi:MAG: valine--tRNA ligase, partial [Burkholderiales bacterium]|nr:valine--tRNA ligase [Phycisphaerae bacterium]
MTEELAKSYDPAAVQVEVAKVWEQEKSFHAEPTDPGEPYSIVIPPPNVTAALHLGHALNNTLQDILIRRARMQGKNACWLPGTDHAGIATQTVVEKRVMQEQGRRRTDFQRDEFVQKIQAWKDEYEQVILGQLKAMGCSCDWERTAFTMDEPRAKAVREAFFQLFKAGLIYRGKRLVNWDPVTLTALADDEVENEEVDGFFYYLRYPVVSEKDRATSDAPDSSLVAHHSSLEQEYITVATTRPETMLGDTAVAINPTDPRAAALRGKFVKLPIVNRVIPIIEDAYVVKPVQYGGDPADSKAQLATGFLKVTPAHDQNDYEIGQRHALPVINIMAPDASISDKHGWTDVGDAGFLLGKSREEARKLVVKWFKDNGLLEDQKPYRHSVGHSYRSHAPIEPYLSDQWYCKVTDDRLAGAALRAMTPSQRGSPLHLPPGDGRGEGASSIPGDSTRPAPSPQPSLEGRGSEGGLKFYPERYAKTYQTWHENIRDWCISRQLWWGHRIPVWTKHYKSERQWWGEEPGSDSDHLNDALCLLGNDDIIGIRFWHDGAETQQLHTAPPQKGGFTVVICLPSDVIQCEYYDGQPQHLAERLNHAGFVQDPDVLDTWFSSGLWPLSTLGWPDSSLSTLHSPLTKWNPTSVLCTAREIVTLWVSRMVMFNEFFLGQVPFKDVFIHAMIQDGEGRKMSKSLGNGVDPLDIISSHGTDALRFTLTSMATNTQDVRMPVVRDETTGKNTSPKFDIGRNFSNKLWNAARFALHQIGDFKSGQSQIADRKLQMTMVDRWILTRFNRTVAECDEAIANYRFDVYA